MGCCAIIAYLQFQKRKSKLKQIGETAEGVVFDLDYVSGDGGNIPYPVIRFVTRNGEWITKQSRYQSLFIKKGK